MQFKKSNVQIPASEALEQIVDQTKTETLTLGDLMTAMHERGFAMLMALFVLPNCLPIPMPPGPNAAFALPLIYLAAQMVLGYDAPKLPGFLSKRTIKRRTLAFIMVRIGPKLKWIEKLLRPRFFFFDTPARERVLGGFWLLFAILILSPIPMTHLFPALGILITSLGILNRDGVTVCIGLVVGILGLCFTLTIVIVGEKLVHHTLATLPTWL